MMRHIYFSHLFNFRVTSEIHGKTYLTFYETFIEFYRNNFNMPMPHFTFCFLNYQNPQWTPKVITL